MMYIIDISITNIEMSDTKKTYIDISLKNEYLNYTLFLVQEKKTKTSGNSLPTFFGY